MQLNFGLWNIKLKFILHVTFSFNPCQIRFNHMFHGGLGSIGFRTGPTPCTGLSVMRQGPPCPAPILCRLGFFFDGEARLFTVPTLI